jgi:DNA-binding winged helix-turn-helix (wHTH) protein
VLCVLLRAAPALVTTEELLDRVWGHRAISASALPQAIRDLRRALGDDARRPTYIETRLRRGYRVLPAVFVEHGTAASTCATSMRSWADRSLRRASNDAFA